MGIIALSGQLPFVDENICGGFVIDGIVLKRNGHKLNTAVDESSTAIMGKIFGSLLFQVGRSDYNLPATRKVILSSAKDLSPNQWAWARRDVSRSLP